MLQINLSTGRTRAVRCLEEEQEDEVESESALACFSSQRVYSMLRCRVCLGNPYLVEGNLLKADAMHDLCWCQYPGEFLECVAEDWSISKGHDSFYVKGQSGSQKS